MSEEASKKAAIFTSPLHCSTTSLHTTTPLLYYSTRSSMLVKTYCSDFPEVLFNDLHGQQALLGRGGHAVSGP